MNDATGNEVEQEPVGIVISRGSRFEHVPAVFAYVWAPAPELEEENRKTAIV